MKIIFILVWSGCYDVARRSRRSRSGQREYRGVDRALAEAHAGAVPLITGVMPPAADPVSLQSATGFSVHGGEHAAMAAEGTEELGRAGIGVGESGTSYASGDAAAAAAYHGAWV